MFDNLFSADSVQLAWEVIQAEIPFAIWETFYVTVVSTALAVVIGLPLGVLLVVGDKNGVLPLPRWPSMSIARSRLPGSCSRPEMNIEITLPRPTR